MFGFSKTCKCCGKEIMFAFSWTDYTYKRITNKTKKTEKEILFYCGWTCFYKTEPEPEDISQDFLAPEIKERVLLTEEEKKERKRETMRRYKERNREKIAKQAREYAKENKDKVVSYQKKYRNKKILEEV